MSYSAQSEYSIFLTRYLYSRAGFMRICHVDKYKKIINIRFCGYFALLLQLKTFQREGNTNPARQKSRWAQPVLKPKDPFPV